MQFIIVVRGQVGENAEAWAQIKLLRNTWRRVKVKCDLAVNKHAVWAQR